MSGLMSAQSGPRQKPFEISLMHQQVETQSPLTTAKYTDRSPGVAKDFLRARFVFFDTVSSQLLNTNNDPWKTDKLVATRLKASGLVSAICR